MIHNAKNKIQTIGNDNDKASEIKPDGIVFHHKLREWALKYNITAYSLNDLLKMLSEIGIPFLPRDARTFLHTPQNVEIENIANGQMWYAGIAHNLTRIFKTTDKDMHLKLNFHVDGVQLFESNAKQFWPILAQIHGSYDKEFQVKVGRLIFLTCRHAKH